LNLSPGGGIITAPDEQRDMSFSDPNPDNTPSEVVSGHPRGTLALVILMGLFFAIGWLAMYFGLFVERGLPHH
jgi:hypothetical protein